jgi:hypothetical protein
VFDHDFFEFSNVNGGDFENVFFVSFKVVVRIVQLALSRTAVRTKNVYENLVYIVRKNKIRTFASVPAPGLSPV